MPANQVNVKAMVGLHTPKSEKTTAHAGSQPIAAPQNVAILNQYPRHEIFRPSRGGRSTIWGSIRLSNDHAFSGGAQAPSAATRGGMTAGRNSTSAI
jgi:hypothetical protein